MCIRAPAYPEFPAEVSDPGDPAVLPDVLEKRSKYPTPSDMVLVLFFDAVRTRPRLWYTYSALPMLRF
jgi:hypothetical protein